MVKVCSVSVAIGINGFGRIGKTLVRIVSASQQAGVTVAAINDVSDIGKLAYGLRRDSLRGNFPGTVGVTADQLIVNDVPIPVFNCPDPASIPWAKAGAEVVIDATGKFRSGDVARDHIIHGGARKVIISASADDPDAFLVVGANDDTYDPARHDVVSPASCGVNALSVMARVLLDRFGLHEVHTCVVLAIQGWQKAQGAVIDTSRGDPRLGRSAAINIIPHDHVVGDLLRVALPELGEITYSYYCAPTPIGSLAELVGRAGRPVTVAEINAAMVDASRNELRGLLHYDPDPPVSADVRGDLGAGRVEQAGRRVAADGRIKVRGFFDNEWGFSHRLLDLARLMG